MNRRFLRITLIGLVAIVAISSIVTWATTGLGVQGGDSEKQSQALANATFDPGVCTSDGVTIVVAPAKDTHYPALQRCVHGDGLTGWQLLQAAQLSPQGTDQYPVGFLCRLMGLPDSSTQDCKDTPKSGEGSWSYFYATADASSPKPNKWQYSAIGSADRIPKCGDYEGWVYSKSSEYDPKMTVDFKPAPFNCTK